MHLIVAPDRLTLPSLYWHSAFKCANGTLNKRQRSFGYERFFQDGTRDLLILQCPLLLAWFVQYSCSRPHILNISTSHISVMARHLVEGIRRLLPWYCPHSEALPGIGWRIYHSVTLRSILFRTPRHLPKPHKAPQVIVPVTSGPGLGS